MSIKIALCAAFLSCAALSACAGDNPQSTRAYNEGYASGCHTENGNSVLTGTPATDGEKSRYRADGNFQAGWDRGNSLCYERAQNGPGEG